jgi:hypothetical protein
MTTIPTGEDVSVQLYQPPSREASQKPAYVIHAPSVSNVDGDGSCLYHCLHRLYQRDMDSQVDLNFIYTRMETTYNKNPELYPHVDIGSIRSAWGGEHELELAAAAFTVIIHAFQQPEIHGPAYRTSVSYPNQNAVNVPKKFIAWGVVLTKLSPNSPQLNHWQYLNTLKNATQALSTPGCNPQHKPPSPIKLVRGSQKDTQTQMRDQLNAYKDKHRTQASNYANLSDVDKENETRLKTEKKRMAELFEMFREQDAQEYNDRQLALMLQREEQQRR